METQGVKHLQYLNSWMEPGKLGNGRNKNGKLVLAIAALI